MSRILAKVASSTDNLLSMLIIQRVAITPEARNHAILIVLISRVKTKVTAHGRARGVEQTSQIDLRITRCTSDASYRIATIKTIING